MSTPATSLVKQLGISHRLHRYQHDSQSKSYAIEAVEKLGLPAEQVFKTLIISIDASGLIVALLPASRQLNMKRLAATAKAKKACMADPDKARRSSGYVLGGVSPLGQKKQLPTYIDQRALQFRSIFVSGGRRGLEIELAPDDIVRALNATVAPIADK